MSEKHRKLGYGLGFNSSLFETGFKYGFGITLVEKQAGRESSQFGLGLS